MYLVAIAWMYVVLMMTLAEARAPNGSMLGAVITFVLYGVLPLAIVLYLMATPVRRRARRAAEALAAGRAGGGEPGERGGGPSAAPPDGCGEPAGDTVTAERKEA